MSQKQQILKLFSHPVFKYQIDDHEKKNKKLLKYIYDLYENDKSGVKKSNINGWHSKSFIFKDEESIPNKFYSDVNKHVIDVFKKFGWVYDSSKVKCTSMWAIINKKDNFNIEHSHSNNYLSAAYYVKAPKNCGDFKASNPSIINRNIYPKSIQATELNSNTVNIKVNEGDLLIFPAYLPHSVEENKSNEDRVIISFNIDILK
jgi:uncharacterized protein (TIGR02466 family)|tara:strand:- start:564 stop:1172 length:609 start_codon:yes stop_codon:yes gene_type:complete